MTKTRLVFAAILFITRMLTLQTTLAQDVFQIRGRVLDKEGRPVGYAKIVAYSFSTHKSVSTMPNLNGDFFLKFSLKGNYHLNVSALGMDSVALNFTINDINTIELPQIKLSDKPTQLKGIEVTATRPLIELKNNKLIYNVGTSSSGFTAIELLKKVPGVLVDGNNNILLKGQSNVKIMLNNKLVQVSGDELTSLLMSKNSSDIDNIEVVSNPSAQYDAAGSGGIININFKRVKKNSFNTSISSTAEYGRTLKSNNSVSLNYQSGNFSLYSTLSAVNGSYWRLLTSDRTIKGIDKQTTYFKDTTNGKFTNDIYSFQLGSDYNITKNSTFGFSLNESNTSGQLLNQTQTTIGVSPVIIDSILLSGYNQHFKHTTHAYDIYYSLDDKKGHSITSSFDYSLYNNSASAIQPNQYYRSYGLTPLNSNTVGINNLTNIDIYAFQIDAQTQLLKGKFSSGIKYSDVLTKNNLNYFTLIGKSALQDFTLSNNFNYKENIKAFYLNYERSWKKISFQAGIRGEQTSSNGNLIPALKKMKPINNTKNYFNVFPSATVNYKFDSMNTFSLNYGRRVDRPNYQTLNPFEIRISELVSQKGNPYLRPQFTDKLSLSYQHANSITASINYNYTNSFINQFIDTSNTKKIIYTAINLGTTKTIFAELTQTAEINNVYSFSSYLYFSHYILKGSIRNSSISDALYSYIFYQEHNFKLPNSYLITLAGYINGPFYYGTFKNKTSWGVDFSVQKKVLHNKGAIVFNAVNLFNTMVIRSHLNFGGVVQNNIDRNENRLFRLSLTYRINSTKLSEQKHKVGIEDESKRLQ